MSQAAAEATVGSRPDDLRMARLHLRLGSLELARAELEAFAGAGALDPDALLDLAEVRWRTGDMAGAGVAAQAYLGEGGDGALALVIAAEATAAMGRPSEARGLANRALQRTETSLDRLFAGIPRSGIWPLTADDRPEPAGELFGLPAVRASGQTDAVLPGIGDPRDAEVIAALAAPPSGIAGPAIAIARASDIADSAIAGHAPTAARRSAEAARAPGLWDEATASPAGLAQAPPPDPAAELLAARADLVGGRGAMGATRLALVLRLAPSLATDVLDAIGGVPTARDAPVPGLELVRGDAYRLVGREVEARRCYAAAAAALSPEMSRTAGSQEQPRGVDR